MTIVFVQSLAIICLIIMFNPDRYPDRYLVTDKESILYYELLEESRYQVEITLIKKILSFITQWF